MAEDEIGFSIYAAEASRTARRLGNELDLAIAALGLVGEASEVSEHIKKHLGHGHPLDTLKVMSELGDVLWYMADICQLLGVDLAAVATMNLSKLRARYPDGFSVNRSLNRE